MNKFSSLLLPNSRNSDSDKGDGTRKKNCLSGAREKFFAKSTPLAAVEPRTSPSSDHRAGSGHQRVSWTGPGHSATEVRITVRGDVPQEQEAVALGGKGGGGETANASINNINFRRSYSDRAQKSTDAVGQAASGTTIRNRQHSPLRQVTSLGTTTYGVEREPALVATSCAPSTAAQYRDPPPQDPNESSGTAPTPSLPDTNHDDGKSGDSRVRGSSLKTDRPPFPLISPKTVVSDGCVDSKGDKNDTDGDHQQSLSPPAYGTEEGSASVQRSPGQASGIRLDAMELEIVRSCLVCSLEGTNCFTALGLGPDLEPYKNDDGGPECEISLEPEPFAADRGKGHSNVPWDTRDICRVLLRPESRVKNFLLTKVVALGSDSTAKSSSSLNPFSLKFPLVPHCCESSGKGTYGPKFLDSRFVGQLSHLLGHAWLQLSHLTQRLSSRFHKCTKLEIVTALKLILPTTYLKEVCMANCSRAAGNYSLSSDNFKIGKSERAGITFDVGKFQRWMVEHKVATFVKEYAPVYAAALMETLCEEVCLLILLGGDEFCKTTNLIPNSVPTDPGKCGLDMMDLLFDADAYKFTNRGTGDGHCDVLRPLVNRLLTGPRGSRSHDAINLANVYVLLCLSTGHPQVPAHVGTTLYSYMEWVNKQLKKEDSSNYHPPSNGSKFVNMAVAKFKHVPPLNTQLSDTNIHNEHLILTDVDSKEKISKNSLKTNGSLVMTIDELLSTNCSPNIELTSEYVNRATLFLWANPNYHKSSTAARFSYNSLGRKTRLHGNALTQPETADSFSGPVPYIGINRNYHTISGTRGLLYGQSTSSSSSNGPLNSNPNFRGNGQRGGANTVRCPHSGPLFWSREAVRTLHHYLQCGNLNDSTWSEPQSAGPAPNNGGSGSVIVGYQHRPACGCETRSVGTFLEDYFARELETRISGSRRFDRKLSCESINLTPVPAPNSATCFLRDGHDGEGRIAPTHDTRGWAIHENLSLSQLKHINTIGKKPTLYNWILAITIFAEHRDGNCIVPEDVYQAAALLLPLNLYPQPSLLDLYKGLATSAFNAYTTNNQEDDGCSERIIAICKKSLAYQMLSAGNVDLVPFALKMLSPKSDDPLNLKVTKNEAQLDIPVSQQPSITPLMYCSIEGQVPMIKTLLSLGVDIDQDVSVTEGNCCPNLPTYYSEISHWTALSFAVMYGHYNLVELLLDNGANVEGGIKIGEELCFSETPLQLASAAGNLEMVTVILVKGGDPYLCTAYNHRSSCCLPPSPSPIMGGGAGMGGLGAVMTSSAPPSTSNAPATYNTNIVAGEPMNGTVHNNPSNNCFHGNGTLLSPPPPHTTMMSDGVNHLSGTHGSTCCGVRAGSHAPFVLAASHGRLAVLKKLLAQPLVPKPRDILSLEEILAEGCSMFMAAAAAAASNSPIVPALSFYNNGNNTNGHGNNGFNAKEICSKDVAIGVRETSNSSKFNVLPSIFTFNPLPTTSNPTNNVITGNQVASASCDNHSEGGDDEPESQLNILPSSVNQALTAPPFQISFNTANNYNIVAPSVSEDNNISKNGFNSNGVVGVATNAKPNKNQGIFVGDSSFSNPLPISLGNIASVYNREKNRRNSQFKLISKRTVSVSDQQQQSTNDYLTLEEILAEGYMPPPPPPPIMMSSGTKTLSSGKPGPSNGHTKSPNLIAKSLMTGLANGMLSANSKNVNICNLTKAQSRVLMEALYHAAESGHVDICMELRNLGIPWNLHIWIKCLIYIYGDTNSINFLQPLLADFTSIKLEEVNVPELMEIALPIMLDIFWDSLFENVNQSRPSESREEDKCEGKYDDKRWDESRCYVNPSSLFVIISRILATCYTAGFKVTDEVIPPITRTASSIRSTLIDPCYVNSPELSDISFLVERQIFYGHKIILVNSSPRFKAMLSNKFAEGSQNIIEIRDIRYPIFKVIMEFLYSGKIDSIVNQNLDFILELMAASNFFLLDGLQRECEILCSKILNNNNCVSIYKTARLYACEGLANYCIGYFLKHMACLVVENSTFTQLLTAPNFAVELHTRIYYTLMARLQERLTTVQTAGYYGFVANNQSYLRQNCNHGNINEQ